MAILVFGETGQVARELAVLPVTLCIGRDAADLRDAASCAAAIRSHKPAAVINAAAYTAVDAAETDEAQATSVNGTAPGAMAQACAALGIPMVQISTDYVFAGHGESPWQPDDATAPLGAYGRSKLAGEMAVRDAGGAHAILRTSWVVSAHGANFVKTMLRLGAERDSLNVVADQIGGPTAAADIAAACHRIAKQLTDAPDKTGTYHFSGAPDCSWADFARAIFDEAGLNCTVHDIPSSDYPTPAKRPLNSRMDCCTTHKTFGIERPQWQASLTQILKDLGASK
ncbi:dTDP-4-dehydrorhamnose reductase [Sulfitobacter mediterraneus]|uniref:dTDP-4-dehydrorhamnose reductase n=1 Tax=Sulfitobacter mediterraneus TaxID=83219 RepID=UPI0019311AA3|nr:dTDP-4-dehydrorhamnose reductase [Sulfitobacter mediterraneus]MBM1308680.1 dTDP-4-dehydrorhamnose reductase [Sulfitobacter mediterraneus]MBM1312565.1 dTDP-4-dehydrorhamnose reductase [Sulfitobacter mediterraneus]MBM1320946.1 dTDP-4-dehydrorhamnose reductase [Sulfitobacter mediterraneus]MBM1324834.1 dTDP-4-dehydrorhamnose reductase [Sulfitobacter mediterraneus]MBM1396180.1 dTDP-4-dehydrorhamnose reductase [Sulfitobacter mediterraneus]